jgi:hypothetical protein
MLLRPFFAPLPAKFRFYPLAWMTIYSLVLDPFAFQGSLLLSKQGRLRPTISYNSSRSIKY